MSKGMIKVNTGVVQDLVPISWKVQIGDVFALPNELIPTSDGRVIVTIHGEMMFSKTWLRFTIEVAVDINNNDIHTIDLSYLQVLNIFQLWKHNPNVFQGGVA